MVTAIVHINYFYAIKPLHIAYIRRRTARRFSYSGSTSIVYEYMQYLRGDQMRIFAIPWILTSNRAHGQLLRNLVQEL
jgi:hypothetical protein